MAKQSNVTFEVTKEFLAKTDSDMDHEVKAFISANPGAMLRPTGKAGEMPPFLGRKNGKRWDIHVAMSNDVPAEELLTIAAKLGGGYRDIAARLAGGYSPSSKTYGQSFVVLAAG